MKKLLIIAICLFGLSPFLKAQMLNLNYQISLPMNQVKDFTDKASFRGFDITILIPGNRIYITISIESEISGSVFFIFVKDIPANSCTDRELIS